MKQIDIQGITKSYGTLRAVDNVSLTFEENKIYGLLGRNGAGKTTLLNMMTGRIFPDGGFITVDGERSLENDNALGKIYMQSEMTCYPEKMKLREAFKWTKQFYPEFDLAYANRLADQFKLNTSKPVKSLSTGYTSIYKLILALSCGADYIIFDEPVLGLDANHRDLFYKSLLERYMEKPCCMIISTHLVEEVSRIIEKVIIIKNGAIIHNEPTDELLSKGFTISGSAAKVDEFTSGMKKLGEDALGALKSAYILGDIPKNVPDGLEITRLDLQKLFVQLTND